MSKIKSIQHNNTPYDIGVEWDNIDNVPGTFTPGVHTHPVSDITGLVINNVPAGVIMPYMGNGNLPAGYLLCNGQGVSKTTYAALFGVIGYTYGGSGDTFNLPDLTGRFLEGGSAAGALKDPGLPNITGTLSDIRTSDGADAAAAGSLTFTATTNYPNTVTQRSNRTYYDGITFNASNSSAIYGAAETVQPKSIVVKFIIKY